MVVNYIYMREVYFMNAWWNGLDMLMKVLYCIAVPATLVLLIQTVLSVVGFGQGGAGVDISDTSGLDMDFDPAPDVLDFPDSTDLRDYTIDGGNPSDFSALQLFTLQGIIAFLTVFSWTSIISINSGTPELLGLFIGLVLGLAVMVGVAKLIQLSQRLTENGTINLKNALGGIGTVYITIPPQGGGQGKIMINIQGSYTECSAITMSNTSLPSNTPVRVTDVRGDVLVVEKDTE